jgi:hypothetical protein
MHIPMFKTQFNIIVYYIAKGEFTGMFLLNKVEIEDTFAELFKMWVGRIIITAENEKWASTAANIATGTPRQSLGRQLKQA